MHTTPQRRVWLSRMMLCHGGELTQACALLRRWKEMCDAPVASATAPAATLLDETLAHLKGTSPVETSTTITKLSCSSHTPQLDGTALFHSPKDAELIWSAMQRQRVPWQAALQLLPWQLQAMTPAQRAFVQQRLAHKPWEATHVVLTACDVVEDTALVQQFRTLKRTTHMVEFARLISAALRERPSLPDGLLPVPHGVMQHAYALGRRSPQEAAMALKLSKHLRLLGRSALTRSAEEHLVLGHAALEGQVGNWAVALAVVAQSRAVRLSARKGFERFVQLSQRKTPTQPQATKALAETTGSRSNGVGGAGPLPAPAVGAFKASEDEPHNSAWLLALQAFTAQPPERQTYAAARTVLAALPRGGTQDPDAVLITTAVLQHAARRMYSGTFTRRFVSTTRKADWPFALSLATAAGYYDLAVPLLPLLPNSMKLPADLQEYVAAAKSMQQNPASSLPLTRTVAASLSYPQALAYAVEGDGVSRQTLLSFCPQSQPVSRLRWLLLASCQTTDGDAAGTVCPTHEGTADDALCEIDCCTFQSSALSRLVCGAASEKRRRYFCKVIPASMRVHHFCVSSPSEIPTRTQAEKLPGGVVAAAGEVSGLPATKADVVASAHGQLQRWRQQVASTPAACAVLLSDLSTFLRATHAVEGVPVAGGSHAKPRLTEEVFLRCVAILTAWGTVQLPATERFHWPLQVLKAACLLRVVLDATLVSSATRSVPSLFADHATLALPAMLTAHTLLGNWQAGLQMCVRLVRKEKQGAIHFTTSRKVKKPQTDRYRAPPPSLEEAMAQVGYGAPQQLAIKHWAALDALSSVSATTDGSASFPLMLVELKQFHDTRQLREEVRRNSTPSAPHMRMNARLERLSRRRMLLGAAFALLNDAVMLQYVVHASGQRRVRAEDLDVHGLQRLLSVLPAATASRVLAMEAAAGRCAQEHWLLSCISHPELVSAKEASRLARLRPTSAALSAACCFRAAAEETKPVRCLQSLRRLSEIAVDSPARRALLLCIARLLRAFLSNDDLLQACVQASARREFSETKPNGTTATSHAAAAIAKAALQQSQMLFNRLQEVEQLSGALKHARRVVRSTIHVPGDEATLPSTATHPPSSTPCAAWVLLSSLQVTTSRALHLPIPAAFTSRLFMCAADTADWRAALFLFNELRCPTDAERVALVRALRLCGATATPVLLSHRRFMRHLPEQLMLWADEAAGPLKWERSIALLTSTQPRSVEVQEPQPHASDTTGPQGTPPTAEEETRAEGRQGGTTSETTSAAMNLLSTVVQTAVVNWNADECFRAAQLLHRQGFIRLSAKAGRSLTDVRVVENDVHARRQVEEIIKLLQRRTATAEGAATGRSAPAAPMALPSSPNDSSASKKKTRHTVV